MKKIIYILFLLLVCQLADAAPKVKDPVVMTVGGIKVTRSEFETFYNKNSEIAGQEQHSFDEYVEMYVAYKLKVAEALSRGIDTTQTYIDELESYRRQLVMSFQDEDYWKDSLVNEIAHRIGFEIHASHILLMVDETAPDSLVEAKKMQIEKLRDQVAEGADFAALAKEYSEDPSGKMNGGDLGYFRMLQMVYPFEDAAYSTEVGGLAICRSQFGFHLIKVHDRRKMALDRINPQVVKMINEGPDEAMRTQLKALVSNDEARIAKGMQMLEERWPESEIVKKPEYQALYKEYHDGILLFDVANEEVWDRANKDVEGQQAFFEANREKYKFEVSRFKGAFIECAEDERLVTALRNIYENNDYVTAASLVRSTVLTDSNLTPNPRQPRFHIVNGIFKPGDNPAVDEYLGQKTEKVIREDFPVQMIYGKALDYPESADDVRGLVIADYQDQLEKQFVARLKEKFAVKINKKELDRICKEL